MFALAGYLVLTSLGGGPRPQGLRMLLGAASVAAGILVWKGVYILQPNYSAVFQLFGSYVGTDHSTGMRWVNPFYSVTRVSRRVQSLESAKLKVNDSNGNPIEIAAAVIWRVEDAARAVLQVENYPKFVQIQSETAVRKLASTHPYDDHKEAGASAAGEGGQERAPSLLGGGDDIVNALVAELRTRLAGAGITVDEARITHLAYAPEIAPAMLRRQQAQAIIAARRSIVDGAVDMVHDALTRLGEKNIAIEEDRKASLVSNLLVVLVSDKDATPVVNAGNVY